MCRYVEWLWMKTQMLLWPLRSQRTFLLVMRSFRRVLAGAKRDETCSCVVTPKETKRVGSRPQFPLKVLHDGMSFSLFGKNTRDNRSGEAPRAPWISDARSSGTLIKPPRGARTKSVPRGARTKFCKNSPIHFEECDFNVFMVSRIDMPCYTLRSILLQKWPSNMYFRMTLIWKIQKLKTQQMRGPFIENHTLDPNEIEEVIVLLRRNANSD